MVRQIKSYPENNMADPQGAEAVSFNVKRCRASFHVARKNPSRIAVFRNVVLHQLYCSAAILPSGTRYSLTSLPDFSSRLDQLSFGIVFALDMRLPNARGVLRLKTSIPESKGENVCSFNDFLTRCCPLRPVLRCASPYLQTSSSTTSVFGVQAVERVES